MVENDIDVGLILKKAFKSIIHDPCYILIYLLPAVVYAFFMILMWSIVGTDFMAMSQSMQNPTAIVNILKEKLWLLIGFGIVTAIVTFVVGIIAMAGLIKKVEVQEKGEKLSASDALASGISIFPKLFAAMITGMIIMAGPFIGLIGLMVFSVINKHISLLCLSSLLMVVLFIPWIYIILRLSLYAQACVLDDLGPITCLKKSWHITKGNVLLIFVTMLILGIIAFAITVPFTMASYISPSTPFISSIGSLLVTIIFGPLSGITYTLIYLRITKKDAGMMEGTPEVTSIDSFSSNL